MIVRHLKEAQATDRRVVDPKGNWESTRLLLKDDGMGFSFHMTTIYAGKSFRMHYVNHLESVYCVRGKGNIKTLDDNVVYEIAPGTVYALDKHDEHILTAETELELACVFNPPVTGREVHNADGAYELEE
ncbi:ectoine synthase [Luminiphilus syltensis NOR5-1B]|uniref:L-ectoine synthase n=1 Tax=Luminiphilus syltensis NOR5-1B TaxID=565045 RepID=B8KTM4_9GAMM|nr:ectoine synthase [Luminiphilus syltensis]EED36169.1 ectoine synthase [Luminiphilus syltensis NOR5-1B]